MTSIVCELFKLSAIFGSNKIRKKEFINTSKHWILPLVVKALRVKNF